MKRGLLVLAVLACLVSVLAIHNTEYKEEHEQNKDQLAGE